MAGNDFIAGIGNTNIDLLFSGLERLPQIGEEIYSKSFSLQLGGGVPATMISLGRLGIESRLATSLGEDMFSSFAKEQFLKNGVTPINLYEGGNIPVNITAAMITEEDRTFMSYTDSVTISEKMINKAYEMCKGAKIAEMQVGPFFPVYEKLKKDGTIIVFDCGFDENMSLEAYEKYLRLADYYTPNLKEAMMITKKNTAEEAAEILSEFFEKVVIKLDKNGCLGRENGKSFVVREVPDITAVDSTGAGDAFLAGFIYGLFHNKSLKDCILLGNITGGNSVTKVGCLAAYTDEKLLLETFEKLRR